MQTSFAIVWRDMLWEHVTYGNGKDSYNKLWDLGSNLSGQIKLYLLITIFGCCCNSINNYLQIIVPIFVLGCKTLWGFLNSLFIAEDLGAFFFHFRKFRCLRRRVKLCGVGSPPISAQTNQKTNQNLSNLIWTLTKSVHLNMHLL